MCIRDSNNAVTSFIPEALIGVLTKFGNDQKERVLKIMEDNIDGR